MKNAKEEITHIQNLTKSFLKFANLEKPNFQPVDSAEVIDDLLMDYLSYFDGQIQLEKNYGNDLPYAKADESQLKTALKNILENSINAFENIGTIQIKTELAQKLHKDNSTYSYIIIEIVDNAKGISPENLSKVFEPYFTNSEEGTGFGLTITKKIIEDHQGFIDIHSKLGMGTTVSVWIPVYNMPSNGQE